MPVGLRVLLVEDQERDAQLILRELTSAGFRIESRRVIDAAGLRAAAGEGSWDVVLVEHALLGFGFEEVLEILAGAGVDAPLIVVSGRIGERAVAAALRAGASGYVSKERLEDLGAVVRGGLAERAARRELEAELADLKQAAGVLRGAETAARQAEARVRRLLDGAPDAMIVADRSGVINAVTDQAERLLGFARGELLGESIELLVPDTDRGAHVAHRARFVADPALRPMGVERDLYARHKDGSEIPVAITLSPVQTEDGLLVIAAVRDVSERRQAQARLEASEERLRITIDHAPIGIALVSPDGRWLRVNKALCEMTGYPKGELLDKTFQDMTHPDDLETQLEFVRRMLAGEIATYELEKRLFRADGQVLWIQLSASLVRDRDGRPLHFVSQMQDIGQRKRHERELRHLAEHDALTGLANRRALGRDITRQLTHHARYGGSLALLIIDLDHFKYINDTLGHPVGDRVIRAVAEALSTRLRDSDTVARLGGDEFAILLPQTNRDAAQRVAQELVETLAELQITTPGHELRVSGSIGIVVVDGHDQLNEDDLLAAADLAMYEAKDAGRDRYAIHDATDGSQTRASARLNWSHRIRQALQNDLFVLYYQPIIDLADPTERRYEALIRMVDEPGEPVEPDTFLYIADRYGLMPAIDRWVTGRVVSTLASGQLPNNAIVALNISPRSLTDTALLDLIERLLAEHRIDPRRLIFEVTESAAISRIEQAQSFGRRLQTLGCGFALDDFGTGFGSFIHLKQLPYGYIKIDGEFVHAMAHNDNDRLLVQALATLAHGMGKKTVAEFVGDDETVALLRELGVDYAQGYHLGRPTPPDQLHELHASP
jgi:diguanylate cyclase (GGDEF)-like protein/PAS domain S-box-containing protein